MIADNVGVKQKQMTSEQLNMLVDEQTTMMLASMALDIHTGTLLKNKALVANSFMKIGVILRNNPGFIERFKKAQAAIIAHIKKEGKPSTLILPEAIGELISANPPPPDSL